MSFDEHFRYEDPKCLSFFVPMYEDMMRKLTSGMEAFVDAPPDGNCKTSEMFSWFGLNAMAYGFRKGLAACGCTMEVKAPDGKNR